MSRGTDSRDTHVDVLCRRAKQKIAVLCALVKDPVALAEALELRGVIADLYVSVIARRLEGPATNGISIGSDSL